MEIDKNLIELEISSQDFSKNGWKLLKKYKNEKNNYYALIECESCQKQEIVNYYNFINPQRIPHSCNECKHLDILKSEIGKIYGSVKILDFDHISKLKDSNHTCIYFKTECTNCHKITVRLFNKTQWEKTTICKQCNSTFDNPSLNDLLRVYKKGASERNIEWKLSNEEFSDLVHKNCHYCNDTPKKRKHDQSVNKTEVMGIDRLDSSKSYIIDNCVPCCTLCNFMKQSSSYDNFINQIKKIYNFLEKKGSTTSRETYTQVSGNGGYPEKDKDIV